MPFIKEEDLKKQNKLIKDYLNNRKHLKQKLQNERKVKQQLQENVTEIFQPITKTIKETQKKIDEKLIGNIPQQLAIEDKPRSLFTVDFEKHFTDEEKQLLKNYGFDIDIIELVKGGPDYINDLKKRTIQINKRLGGLRRGYDADTNKIDQQIGTFKKYRGKLNKLIGGLEFTVGRGLKDPNKLCERLHLLVSAKQAGNNNNRLNKEMMGILKRLKSHIPQCDHQKLCDSILK